MRSYFTTLPTELTVSQIQKAIYLVNERGLQLVVEEL